MKKISLALALAASALASPAFAAYTVTVYTGDVGSFNAVSASQSLFGSGTADSSKATFNYNATSLNFTNNTGQNSGETGDLNKDFFGIAPPGGSTTTAGAISGYTKIYGPNGNVDYSSGNQAFNTLSNFLNASGSAGSFKYGSLYVFQSDVLVVAGQTLTINHDDGVSLYLGGSFDANGTYSGGTSVGSFTSSPTTVKNESYTFTAADAGKKYTIVYGRENGSPSVLTSSLTGAVPEPATWGMMVLGFGIVGRSMRRRRQMSVTSFA